MSWTRLFFSQNGRISRRPFWRGTLALIGLLLLVYLPLIIAWPDEVLSRPAARWVRIIMFASELALAWPTYAVTAKREMDRGRRPLLAPLALVLSLAYSVLDVAGWSETAAGYTYSGATSLAGLALVAIVVIIELGCLRGSKGPNRFGPDPLQQQM